MADSPRKQNGGKTDLISFKVLVDGEELSGQADVQEISVTKELNKIPVAKLVISDEHPSGDQSEPKGETFEYSEQGMFSPGKTIKVTAGYHGTEETIFEGIIVSQRVKVNPGDPSSFTVYANDKAQLMTMNRKNKYYPEKKDNEIIQSVIGEHGLSAEVDSTSILHEEMVQYHSSDWDFIMSRAEENGFIVAVDDGKVTVGKPKVDSGPIVKLKHGTDIVRMDLEMDARTQIPSVKANGWDMSGQSVVNGESSEPPAISQGAKDGKTLASDLGVPPAEMHSSRPFDAATLKQQADAKLLKSRLARIRGRVIFNGHAGVKPNTTIELEGVSKNFNGTGYVSAVLHTIFEGYWVTEATLGVDPNGFTESANNIQEPSAGGSVPGVKGIHIGKVQKIDADPQGEFRVLVDVPTITETGDGIWARLAMPFASENCGFFWFPELGDEVIVGFLGEDPRYPVILGNVYSKARIPGTDLAPTKEANEEGAPMEPNADNSHKSIILKSNMKLEFNDKDRVISIWTPNKNYLTISDKDQQITIQDETSNKMVFSPAGIEFYTPKDFILNADGNIDIAAKQNITIKADMDMSSEAMNITAKAQVKIANEGATAEVKGSAQTTIKGGMVMIN